MRLNRALKGISDREAGRRVGCSAVTICLARNEMRKIGLELAVRMRQEFGVPLLSLPLTDEARDAAKIVESWVAGA